MKKAILFVTLLSFICIQISFAQSPWVFDTARHSSVIQMCQDGYILASYAFGSNLLEGRDEPYHCEPDCATAQPQTPTYEAYLLQANFADVYPFSSSTDHAYLNEAGMYVDYSFSQELEDARVRQIGEPFTLTIEEQSHPYFASDSTMALWYDIGIVAWGELVDVGRHVTLSASSNGDFVARVADCMLPTINEIQRVSVNTDGEEGAKQSAAPSLSGNGMRIAFESLAPNLDTVGFDDNDVDDIYLHTQTTGVTRLISEIDGLSERVAADGLSTEPDISFSGSRIVYASEATTLESAPDCPADGMISHVYLYDWNESIPNLFLDPSGAVTPTVRVDIPAGCADVDGRTYRPSINSWTNSIAMTTDSTVGDHESLNEQFVIDTLPSFNPIATPIFLPTIPSIVIPATFFPVTLVPFATPTPGTPTPTPLPPTLDKNGAADIVGDIFYESDPVLLSITNSGTTTETGNGASDYAHLSVGNDWVVFQTDATNFVTDTNGVTDIILRHTTGHTVTLISVSSRGEQADGASFHPVISANGNQIAFESAATNLAADVPNGTTQIYVHSRNRGCTTLLSRSNSGDVGNGLSTFPAMSADGRFVAFSSTADNLVPNDGNGFADIFIVDRDADNDGRIFAGSGCEHDVMQIQRVSIGLDGEANGNSFDADFSADGAWLGFTSEADNLIEGDMNGAADVFVLFNGYPTQLRVYPPPLSVGVHTTTADNSPALLMTIFGLLILSFWSVVFVRKQ